MKPYTEFVNRTYKVIEELNENYKGSFYTIFTKGPNAGSQN